MLSIGLMSGSSMNGIEAALIETDGKTRIAALADISLDYAPEFQLLLKTAEHAVRERNGDLPAASAFYPQALNDYLSDALNLTDAAILAKQRQLSRYFHHDEHQPITFNEVVQRSTALHAELVQQLLERAGYRAEQIDVVGYHGQTLYHRPAQHITVQVGDGQRLAEWIGITVVDDFRSRDLAAGGQGAPFAPLYHQTLAARDGRYPVAVVNCGGIANITVITGETEADLLGFDTGPASALLDRCVRQRTQGRQKMDADGQYGKQGRVHQPILDLLYQKAVVVEGENYFSIKPPKSLDSGNLRLIPELDALTLEDACATLAAFTADTVVKGLDHIPQPPKQWIVAGGGWNNPVVYHEFEVRLRARLGQDVTIMRGEEAGWDSQALEAQIFAWLAVRCLQKLPISVPGTTGVPRPLSGGRIHLAARAAG